MREVAHVRDQINSTARRKLLNKLKEVSGDIPQHNQPKKEKK